MEYAWYFAVLTCFIAAFIDNDPQGRAWGYLFVLSAFVPEWIMPVTAVETASEIFVHGGKYLLLNAIVLGVLCLIYITVPNIKSCQYLKRCLWGGYLLIFALVVLFLEYLTITASFDIILLASTVYYAICAYTIYTGRSNGSERISIFSNIFPSGLSLPFDKSGN